MFNPILKFLYNRRLIIMTSSDDLILGMESVLGGWLITGPFSVQFGRDGYCEPERGNIVANLQPFFGDGL